MKSINRGDIFVDTKRLFSHMVMGGITNSLDELSTYHEQLNYDYLSPIPFEMDSSPANSTANMWTNNDPLSIQYVYDVEEAKYKNGWSTIETSDLRKEVEDFKSSNPSNVIDLKTAR